MSLPYFLAENPRSGVLEGAEAKHAGVKRIAPGERIVLFDGRGTRAEVEVTDVAAGRVAGDVVDAGFVEKRAPRVTVVQAIPKGERAELAVDLAVQGGADAIVPWISHRTIARWPANKQAKQVEKWRSQALASAKQARRAWVPEVGEPVTTNQLCGMVAGRQVLVLHEEAAVPLRDVEFAEELFLVVGPEGGIGAEELELIGGQAVKLGPEVLRTASAAFAGLCAIGALSGRW